MSIARLVEECHKRNYVVALALESSAIPVTQKPRPDQPRLMLLVRPKGSALVADHSVWAEAGAPLERAALAVLKRMAGKGLLA